MAYSNLVRLFSALLLPVIAVTAPAADKPQDSTPPATAVSSRDRLLMDAGWRFAFGHPTDPQKDFDHATGYFSYFAKAGYGDGPAAPGFDDAAWRQLDLPHDWAVELPFAAGGSPSHGYKAVGRNFPETSVGWYRKTLSIPAADLGRRISVVFDGVFRDSVVWINGFYLGREPSGYTSFRYDVTDYLNYGGENVIAVRVNATMEEGWFYEGAGIYRHTWLEKTAPLHVAADGTYVTTALQGTTAAVTVRTTVANDGTSDAAFEIEQAIIAADGKTIATARIPSLVLPAGTADEFAAVLHVSNPQLWSLESPTLHRLVTTVRVGGAEVDHYETTFGIRTIRFDPDAGFFLNGKRVEIKGTNNHQDHAGVGVALPDALQDFRITQLKRMGSNAYRCSHNPPTPEFLDACDRLGLLVLDENRLMGPSPEQMSQLGRMIRRDRNHPSVILWSLGNEEWGIEGNIKGARIAATMQAFAQRLDPSRRTTVAISGGWGGISSVIDVAGFNYIKQGNTDKQHAEYPRQPGIGTEETTTQGTRGIYFDDRARAHLAPVWDGSSGGNAEIGWKHYVARPYLAGVFFWTGFDYRGETTPFDWPAISSQFGILDTCGFPKDSFYYMKAWWGDEPVLHIFPHWNWPGREGQGIDVWCYSNCDEVELALNGQSLGKKEMPRNGHLVWPVVYQPGVLEARGYRGGKLTETSRVETTGQAVALRLTPDRAVINANGEDLSVVSVEVVDAKGRVVPTADNQVTFELAGPGHILGVGNGDPVSHEPDQYHDAASLVTIEDWRGRIAPPGTVAPSEPATQAPLAALGNWQAPRPKSGDVYDLSGAFSLGALPAEARLHLFLPKLGGRTSVWVNGRELAHELDTSATGPSLALERGQLITGLNRVQLIVIPFADQQNHIPEIPRLGSVQILTPAPAYQRSVFNGLAQVIVQARKEAGIIKLTAQAEGLTPAVLMITAQPAALRASVP